MSRAKRQRAERHGQWAERLAVLVLTIKGYRILARQFRTDGGEIDIVAKRGTTLVFAEVKARATVAQALEAVTIQQRRRIERAAAAFIAGRGGAEHARFDVIAVVPGRLPRHLPDAWRPNLA